jgi:hypothetical protein
MDQYTDICAGSFGNGECAQARTTVQSVIPQGSDKVNVFHFIKGEALEERERTEKDFR